MERGTLVVVQGRVDAIAETLPPGARVTELQRRA